MKIKIEFKKDNNHLNKTIDAPTVSIMLRVLCEALGIAQATDKMFYDTLKDWLYDDTQAQPLVFGHVELKKLRIGVSITQYIQNLEEVAHAAIQYCEVSSIVAWGGADATFKRAVLLKALDRVQGKIR